MKKLTGAMIAVAVAGLVGTSTVMATESSSNHGTGDQVKCYGVNSCKGTSACKTSTNSCKGMNSCKGKGFMMVNTADDCDKAGGKLSELNSDQISK